MFGSLPPKSIGVIKVKSNTDDFAD